MSWENAAMPEATTTEPAAESEDPNEIDPNEKEPLTELFGLNAAAMSAPFAIELEEQELVKQPPELLLTPV
jgi:hypothetical protein